MCFFGKEIKFSSQHPCRVDHNQLCLKFQGDLTPLTPPPQHLSMRARTHTHTHMKEKEENKNHPPKFLNLTFHLCLSTVKPCAKKYMVYAITVKHCHQRYGNTYTITVVFKNILKKTVYRHPQLTNISYQFLIPFTENQIHHQEQFSEAIFSVLV